MCTGRSTPSSRSPPDFSDSIKAGGEGEGEGQSGGPALRVRVYAFAAELQGV